jgi:hypothetical protein
MADPSESFVSSFNNGLNFAMKMDTLQVQEQMRQLQMQEMALKLIDHQNKMALGQQFQDTPEYSPSQLEPSKIRPGAYSLPETAVPVSTTRSPVMESFLQQFPKQLHPFVEAAAKTGNYEWAEKVPKIEGQKAFTLQPGAVHYMPDASSPGGLKRVQGPPKEGNWQRKTRTSLVNGKIQAQDYDWNPTNREEIPVGTPYPYRDPLQPQFVMGPKDVAGIAHGIRNEMKGNPNIKDYQELGNKYRIMEQAYEESKKSNNFVAVDQALITLFNKMTDPNSVVRESEYARTSNDLAFINRVKGKAMKILEGGAGLTPDERKELYKMGKRFKNSYERNYDDTVKSYGDLAEQSGINRSLIETPYKRKQGTRPLPKF